MKHLVLFRFLQKIEPMKNIKALQIILITVISAFAFSDVNAQCALSVGFSSVDNGNGNYSFTDTSSSISSAIVSWEWKFSGGFMEINPSSSNLQNPEYTFDANFDWPVTLIVTDSNGCIDSTTQFMSITSFPCNTTFTTVYNGNGNYSFSSSSSDSDFYSEFSFGGIETNINGLNANYTFTSNGIHIVALLSVDSTNCISYFTDTINVTEAVPCNIEADFTYTDNGNGDFTFTDASNGAIDSYNWNFGDGTTLNTLNPNHTFNNNGMAIVQLAIRDSNGCVDYHHEIITVTGVNAPTQCNAAYVMFTDTTVGAIYVINSSAGNNLTFTWDFGDGNTSTEAFPSYTYAGNGPYYLCLSVDDGAGCTDTYCDSIGVNGIVFKKNGFSIQVSAPPLATAVSTEQQTVSEFKVYPNPFRNNVTIELNLTEASLTTIFVTDLLGNNVAQLNNSVLNKGNSKFVWEPETIANGVYLLNIKTDSGLKVEKLILNR
jgi:PKD repeat protein